jgi:glutamine---fructose-6-phosphate transaminase (isomerizing)
VLNYAKLLNKEASPGVRSYQVTLLSLFLIGMQLASHQGSLYPHLVEEFESLGEAVSNAVQTMHQPIRGVVELITNAPAFIVAGSGPNRGTALYAAAKFVESLGRLATGVDIDEWFHIERHLMNPAIPIILIAPPGNSIQRATEVANMATNLGQSVLFVTAEGVPLPIQANHIPLSGKISEFLSPLLYYIFAPMLAGFCAEQTGTNLFPNRANSLSSNNTFAKIMNS